MSGTAVPSSVLLSAREDRLPTFSEAIDAWRAKCVMVPRGVLRRAVIAAVWDAAVVDRWDRTFNVYFDAVDTKCRALMLAERLVAPTQTLVYAEDCTPRLVLHETMRASEWVIAAEGKWGASVHRRATRSGPGGPS